MTSLRTLAAVLLATALLTGASAMNAQRAPTSHAPEVLLRLDDVGMNHSVNTAIARVAQTGMPFSVSVMFACPWYEEAVDILEQHPQIAAGVHLVLNSEWRNYRWGPVLGKAGAPSLTDGAGYFLLSRLAKADPSRTNLFVVHVAEQTPEMSVLFDRNNAAQNSSTGLPLVANHRQAELDAMLSPDPATLVRSGRVKLVTYADLVARAGPVSTLPRP